MLKILELFGGIGACSKALERLGIEYEIADYVEIDKYAVKSFNAMHHTNFEPQDICKWDKDIEVDLIMHGSPCQDFSLAGLQAGGDEGSGTRSSLMYETIRIVNKLKPKYVIWENVKNMISKKHIHNFNNYIERMGELGYTSYYQVLNAKNYGIPQNRERVFTISIRNDLNIGYVFPEKKELKLKLKDMLEDNVDEKYYLSDNMIQYLEYGKYKAAKVSNKVKQTNTGICPTLDTMQGGNRQPFIDEKYYLSDKMKDYITSKDDKYKVNEERLIINRDIACSKTTREGNSRADTSDYICKELPENTNLIKIKNATKKGYLEAKEGDSINLQRPTSTTRRGRVQDINNISDTLVAAMGTGGGNMNNLRIRKLTPKECWRLMGFDDIDFEKASKVNSNTQLYKQAGNSIVVNVLEAILKNLLLETNNDNVIEGQMTIYNFINE